MIDIKKTKAKAHLLREWTPYAMFRCWIDSRSYCDAMANSDDKNKYQVRIRHGWYVVERKRESDEE